MLRSVLGFVIIAGILAAIPTDAFSLSLDGWTAFKFGMSPDQARTVPDQNFGPYYRKDSKDQKQGGVMASEKPALVYGVPYGLDLFFNNSSFFHSSEALDEIVLQNEKTNSRSDCEASFLTLLSQLEKTYGAFLPVYPQQKKNDQDLLPISIEWKTGSGASRYQLATFFLYMETAYVWNARKVYGGRYLDAVVFWSAEQDDDQAVCLTELDFKS